jgi:hypothetical protein
VLVDGEGDATLGTQSVIAVGTAGSDDWDMQKEGNAQGGYYDPLTGTRWLVKGYSLYKRQIP